MGLRLLTGVAGVHNVQPRLELAIHRKLDLVYLCVRMNEAASLEAKDERAEPRGRSFGLVGVIA